MKIRIKGNSIRLRLGRSEVTSLCDQGLLLETTQFPSGDFFDYSIILECVDDVQAFILENGIQVAIPEELGRSWAGTDEVGISTALDLPEGGQLSVLIEKDFQCMKARVDEDESNLYPNPAAG